MKLLTLILAFSFTLDSFAKYHTELSGGFGMTTTTFTETAVNLEGDNISEPETASIGPISANFYWKFLPIDNNKSFHLSAVLPMVMISSGDTYFNLSGGFEYYFNDHGHKMSFHNNGIKIGGVPKLRYFALTELGVGFASYTTEVTKKNDTFFEISAGGGASYALTENWGLRGFASVGMGSGSITNSMTIKFFIGGSYFLSN